MTEIRRLRRTVDTMQQQLSTLQEAQNEQRQRALLRQQEQQERQAEKRALLDEQLEINPNVCRVAFYDDEAMYVRCGCTRKCVNNYKYHRYTIVDNDTVSIGGDSGRSSHCSVIGMHKPIVLVFNEGNHSAKKISHGINLETGYIYRRRRRGTRKKQLL